MISLTTEKIALVTHGTLRGPNDIRITSITTDSRKACMGSLFACIKGERTDGHNYISQALTSGTAAVLCEKAPKEDVPYILVDSTVKALGRIAGSLLDTAGIPVIAVTGSVGKTSTKEMIASVISQKLRVLKTEANFNNDLGLPLTVFNLEDYHEAAVLELGIDDFGQMDYLASIAKPDICVFTNIGDCHLEQLGDRPGVWRAKSEMIGHMKADGRIVLNGDDEILREQKEIDGRIPLFYGLNENNDVRACDIKNLGVSGSAFTVVTAEGNIPVRLSVPGEHNIRNALAAASIGRIMGLSDDQIRLGIESYVTISGRFKIINTETCTVIDDCYNANPMSMKAALSSLSRMEGKKIAVLGDMGELGSDSKRFHREVGICAGTESLDALFCVGEASKEICRGAKEAGREELLIRHYDTIEEMLPELKDYITSGDVILVKASHFMQFERVLKELLP